MIPIKDFKPQERSQGAIKVPAGVYIAKIIDAKEKEVSFGRQLFIGLDIIEGEYTGAYKKRYEADLEYKKKNPDSGDVKWKGTLKLTTYSNNEEYNKRNKVIFENNMWCIEDSNTGFHFDGEHEKELVGKVVGINVRDNYYNGRAFTEIGQLESVNRIREGKVNPMKPRGVPEETAPSVPEGYTSVEDEPLPF